MPHLLVSALCLRAQLPTFACQRRGRTQEFFARLLAKHYRAAVHPERGKFRWFLLAAVNGVGNISFADGHAETHRWVDPRTKPPLVRDHPMPRTVEGDLCPLHKRGQSS